MKVKNIPNKLPLEFYFFFWDIDPKKLDPSKKPYYVINRLLDKGNLEAVRWVRRNFPQELIIEVVKKSKDLSPKTAVFWARFYNIPREQVVSLETQYILINRKKDLLERESIKQNSIFLHNI